MSFTLRFGVDCFHLRCFWLIFAFLFVTFSFGFLRENEDRRKCVLECATLGLHDCREILSLSLVFAV